MSGGIKKFFLVDGSALAYRSYFAFSKNPLINSKGVNTSAAFGFTSALLRLLREEDPAALVVVFDSQEPTFRHAAYPQYKATREKMPDELVQQLPLIDQVVTAMALPLLRRPGFEADDIIGTLALRAREAGFETFIFTGDKDFMQLVRPGLSLYSLRKDGKERDIIDRNGVIAKLGVPPEQVTEMLGLMGDASDNIPGVPGVGEKTAQALIQQFGNIETIQQNLEQIDKPALRKKLAENHSLALLSRQLATIETQVPLDQVPQTLLRRPLDAKALYLLFRELEFESLLGQIDLKTEAAARRSHLVDSHEQLDDLFRLLQQHDLFCLDTETTGLDYFRHSLLGIAVAVKAGEGFFIPIRLPGQSQGFPAEEVLPRLAALLGDGRHRLGGHNFKFDLNVLFRAGLTIEAVGFDTMIASYLLDPGGRQHGLDALALKDLGQAMTPITDLIGKGKNEVTLAQVPLDQVCAYAAADAAVSLELHHLYEPKLKDAWLDKLYHELELPLVPILAEMERTGIKVDAAHLHHLSGQLGGKLSSLEQEIHRLAGEPFNINSPKQLGQILFEKMAIQNQLGLRKVKKTKTGYATGSEVLETMTGHPIAALLLEYRNLAKLKSTYLDALPGLIHPLTGRLHTSFNQTVTATGRLSSSEPNLQNIPIRSDLGKEIRRAFIPGEEGWLLLSADYSQIELRILAHLADEEALSAAFRNGEDIHAASASILFGIPREKVSAADRDRVKAFNYGIIYGMGPQRLARETGIRLEEARQFIDSYFEKFPRIRDYIDAQQEKAAEAGFVETILGRKRWLPEINSANPMLRMAAANMAVNTPIQGSAADLIKVAMIHIRQRLKEEKLAARLLLQVHDELLLEAPATEIEALETLVHREMTTAMSLNVPLEVRLGIGRNWLEAH